MKQLYISDTLRTIRIEIQSYRLLIMSFIPYTEFRCNLNISCQNRNSNNVTNKKKKLFNMFAFEDLSVFTVAETSLRQPTACPFLCNNAIDNNVTFICLLLHP